VERGAEQSALAAAAPPVVAAVEAARVVDDRIGLDDGLEFAPVVVADPADTFGDEKIISAHERHVPRDFEVVDDSFGLERRLRGRGLRREPLGIVPVPRVDVVAHREVVRGVDLFGRVGGRRFARTAGDGRRRGRADGRQKAATAVRRFHVGRWGGGR